MASEGASDPRVNVVLVIHNYKTSINKNKAIENSNYFSSLLSGNFSDHNLEEHQINYDIPVEIFQTFIDWIENTKPESHSIIYLQPEECLTSIASDYINLLELLKTSVLLMSEKLTRQLTRIIITKWLNPDNAIDIWKFAQEYAVRVLQDVAFEVCLDKFSNIPPEKLTELSQKEVVELIANLNINDNYGWAIKKITSRLLERFPEVLDPDEKQILEIVDSNEEYNPNYLPCLVTYKLNETKKKSYGVYYLKERELLEFVGFNELFDFLDDGHEVAGRKIIGRRFSIFVIGGEKGLGSGRFIKSIWRYCVLSRTWYYVTDLPTARRHMVAEFVDKDLYLVGGVGSYRVKLSSVDILNIHTNEWSKGKTIPEEFTEMLPSCVADKNIIYCSTKFHLYPHNLENWVGTNNYFGTCYAMVGNPNTPDVYSFYSVPAPKRPDESYTMIEYAVYLTNNGFDGLPECKRLLKKREYHRHTYSKPLLVSFFCEDGKIFVEKGNIQEIDYKVLDSFYQRVDNITPSLFTHQLGCFNIIDPDTLYKKVSEKL